MNQYHVPETHEEVVAHFENYPDEFLGPCLLVLYECRIAQGDSVMLAYENALRDGLGMPNLEPVEQGVEPTLDTSPVFVPKPCVICGQMVCNH